MNETPLTLDNVLSWRIARLVDDISTAIARRLAGTELPGDQTHLNDLFLELHELQILASPAQGHA